MNEKSIIGGVIILILAVGGILFATSKGGDSISNTTTTPEGEVVLGDAPKGALELAQCLSAKGATFYGAFWCSHCRSQKALFGTAASALPYVECSTPNGNDQVPVCKDKKIVSYPTWTFQDGSEVTGEQSFTVLANKTGCIDPTLGVTKIPETEATTTTELLK